MLIYLHIVCIFIYIYICSYIFHSSEAYIFSPYILRFFIYYMYILFSYRILYKFYIYLFEYILYNCLFIFYMYICYI